MIKKGSWIEIEKIDYYNKYSNDKVFVRGNCLSNCDIGDIVKIRTITGHIAEGIVSESKYIYDTANRLQKDCKEILLIRKN